MREDIMKRLALTIIAMLAIAAPVQAGTNPTPDTVTVDVCSSPGTFLLTAFPGYDEFYRVRVDGKVLFEGVIGPYLTLSNEIRRTLVLDVGDERFMYHTKWC